MFKRVLEKEAALLHALQTHRADRVQKHLLGGRGNVKLPRRQIGTVGKDALFGGAQALQGLAQLVGQAPATSDVAKHHQDSLRARVGLNASQRQQQA